MTQLDGRVDAINEVATRQPGSFLQVLGDDITPIIEANEKTRLRIPILFGVDAIHGHSFWPGATIFPTQLGLAASWNEELLYQVAEITRAEMFYNGVSWTFSPVLCLTRDLRWGRVGETFGEDPVLIGRFASAMIRGYQGDDLTQGVLACAKHFTGYSETQGGRDASEADLSKRKIRSYFLDQFYHAVAADVQSFMIGYQSTEGIPSTANRWLLRNVLRDEWRYEGFLVTDWDNVGRMVWEQKTCADYEEAAVVTIDAGNDMSMSTVQFNPSAIAAGEAGRINMHDVDQAVRRILRSKFRLGLFENCRRPDNEKMAACVGAPAHRAVALQAARESIVLLRNNENVLPLTPVTNSEPHIAIIGPNADAPLAQLGDWSLGSGQANNESGVTHPRDTIITVKDGLEARFPHTALFPWLSPHH